MNFNINWGMVKAISKRDLRLYFTNPTGYVFITLFIFLSAAAAFWQERFFLNNLANLNQLNAIFPIILVFFIPALTMGVWSSEREQGTDELLLTLPATDLEVVLGKYLATLGVYSASLALSLSHVLVLLFLGSPDLGLMFGNYLGYWLIGASFIAVGMLASLLTPNATISFILGALFCAGLGSIDSIGGLLGETVKDFLSPLGVFGYFGDFAKGVISFSGLLYFISLAAVMLYLNVLLLGQRHWPAEADGWKMSWHHALRTIAIVVAVISANAILGRMNLRVDTTAEQLHSLSGQTYTLIDEIPDDRPVFIQAFVSKDVPQQLVQTRENLLSFLDEIGGAAGTKVQVIINHTEPYSQEARDAREKFGIVPREVPDPSSARASIQSVFMGLAMTSGAREEIIPFFERGFSTEYELVRTMRMVAQAERKKIGVVVTEAKLFGGFDFAAGRTSQAWQVLDELKKQYEVVRIAPNAAITETLDGLIIPMPSTLPQESMDHVLNFIETGVPTLLLVDPIPTFDIGISPSEKPGANRNPFMNQNQPPPKDKGNINAFMQRIGVSWNIQQIVFDRYNPHPDLATLPPQIVFVGRGNNNPDAFNNEFAISSHLQEIVMMFPGYLNKVTGSDIEFHPLIKTGRESSGVNQYGNLVRRSFFGSQLFPQGAPRHTNSVDYTLAARVKSNPAVADSATMPSSKSIDATVIADMDFVSGQFFDIRNQGIANLNFDNITFFLNCIDDLVGDSSFVDLRNRRVRHRTLTSVESQIRSFADQRVQEEQQAERDAQQALNEAQQRLDQAVEEIQQRSDIDQQAKRIMARNIQEREQRRFENIKTRIDAEKNAKVNASKERLESGIRAIQNSIKTAAVLLPPIPVLILGIMIFVRRRRREAEGASSARRLRSEKNEQK